MVVDELNLIREGPARVKLNGRNIYNSGFLRIFIETVGYEVRFVAEGMNEKSQAPKDPPP